MSSVSRDSTEHSTDATTVALPFATSDGVSSGSNNAALESTGAVHAAPVSIYQRRYDALSEEEKREEDERDQLRRKKPFKYHNLGESLKDVAKQAFFEQSNEYKWTSANGQQYIIWAYKRTGEMSELEHSWPHAYVGEESQTINAAMWLLEEDAEFYKLVAVWTFSPEGDETSVYYLKPWQKDVWALSDACDNDKESPITSKACAEHFSVSSGDYETEAFHCFSLDRIASAEMHAFETAYQANKAGGSVSGKKGESGEEETTLELELVPFTADFDLEQFWHMITKQKQYGLSWGESFTLKPVEPVSDGIKKLVMTCTLVDSLVPQIDEFTESMKAFGFKSCTVVSRT